jgi:hypothetical protein
MRLISRPLFRPAALIGAHVHVFIALKPALRAFTPVFDGLWSDSEMRELTSRISHSPSKALQATAA